MKEVIPIVAQAEAVRPLAELAERIHQAHLESQDAGELHLRYAIEAGQWLNEAKKRIKHGEWMKWLEANVRFSQQMASNYMSIARAKDEVMANYQRVGNLTIREALRLLSEDATEESATPSSSAAAPSASNGAPDPARTGGASSNGPARSSAPARPRQPDPDEEQDEDEDDSPPTQAESQAVADAFKNTPPVPSGKPWQEKAAKGLGVLVRALSAAELYEKHRLALEAIHADILGARA